MNAFLVSDETFRYPTAAADYIDHNVTPVRGRIINEFTWGGYLSWRLGARYQVFVDGRTQLYSREFWETTYLCDDAVRINTFRSMQADVALVSVEKSRFKKPLETLGWKKVYADDHAIVLIPARAAQSLSE